MGTLFRTLRGKSWLLGGATLLLAAGCTEQPLRESAALPPVSGGTLLITSDDQTAVAADLDRDMAWLVDLPSQSLRKRVQLDRGTEPRRSIEDAGGNAMWRRARRTFTMAARGRFSIASIRTAAAAISTARPRS